MRRWLELLANAFPAWVLAGAVLALLHPPLFTWFRGPAIVWGLAVIMLGMGLTLKVEDFKGVLRMPKAVAIGFAAQYLIMPFLGWSIARLMQLPPALAAGLILVSCCPGGTASNVVTYIARANVALSVLMTMCSTFGAILFTPILTNWLAGQYIPVDGWGLFWSTVQVVLLPVLAGLALHHFIPTTVRFVLPVAPLVSVITIALICASIIGQNAQEVRQSGAALLGSVFLLHAGGFGLGYSLTWLLRFPELTCRTVSIEVGMQNSGLGAVLAKRHFTDPATALPSAISATFHSVIGSFLAAFWRASVPAIEKEVTASKPPSHSHPSSR